MLGLFSAMDVWPTLGASCVILGHACSRSEAGGSVMSGCVRYSLSESGPGMGPQQGWEARALRLVMLAGLSFRVVSLLGWDWVQKQGVMPG